MQKSQRTERAAPHRHAPIVRKPPAAAPEPRPAPIARKPPAATPEPRSAPIVRKPPAAAPETQSAPIGRLSAARAAVLQFLCSELGAREVRITKLIPAGHDTQGWLVEAEILVPNLEVKMLGLPLTQEILERERYALELDADLTVRSYEHPGPDDE
jgi:hypothetical protein